jgi:hypothetical protein
MPASDCAATLAGLRALLVACTAEVERLRRIVANVVRARDNADRDVDRWRAIEPTRR